MASHAQKGSVSVDAYQWPGGAMTTTLWTAGSGVATWLKVLPLHTPGDGTLHIPVWNGVFRVDPTNWVMRHPDGTINILTNVAFTTLYS